MRNKIKILTKAMVLIVILITVFIGMHYFDNIKAVSNETEKIIFEVSEGETFTSLASDLIADNLIRDELMFKLYIKINNIEGLRAGFYELSPSMDVSQIVDKVTSISTYNPNNIDITFREGINISQIAGLISSETNNSYNDIINKINNEDYLDKLINKYWFIGNDIKNKDFYFSIEGYLFPDTYRFEDKDVTVEEVFGKMFDEMDKVLSKYKKEIENSEYSVHEILTLASIVQYESGSYKDMKDIAGVFYNRLNKDMKLQSSVTVCYVLQDVNHWTDCESGTAAKIDSHYNTYYYKGLPIGPILNPGENAIEATLNFNKNDYLYFMANVCDPSDNKTYFSKTYSEHVAYVKKYLNCR